MNAATSNYPVTPGKPFASYFLISLAVFLFLTAASFACLGVVQHKRPFYYPALIEAGAGCLMLYLARSARNTSLELDATTLRISGNMFGKTIARTELNADEARCVNLEIETDLKPKWRTCGVGLPGYQSGWFRLRNGEKALLFLNDRTNAIYIPTRQGYSLLLNVQYPEEFLRALKAKN